MPKTTIKRIAFALFLIIFLIAVYFFVGQPILTFVNDTDSLKEFIASRGVWGWTVFCFLIIVQTMSTCIPGTPFYLAAGFILGGLKGALVCDIGATIGNSIAFIIGRRLGSKPLYFMFSEEKIKKIEDRIIAKNPVFIHFLFMLLPLPKDTYAWIGFYSKESLPVWIILTYIFRFPHIFVYTFGGELLMEKNYAILIAGAAFAILVYFGLMLHLKKKKAA